MKNPKISVVITIYNKEKYLSECIDSIINQTLKDIEIICVNDGSTDNSLSILKKYALKDDRIKIIDKENEGQGYARKVGLDNASGDYILFCDSDDKYEPNDAFEKLLFLINKFNSDIIIFGVNSWNIDKTTHLKYSFIKDENLFLSNEFIKYIYISNVVVWNKLYSHTFLKKYDDWYFPKKVYMYQDAPLHRQIVLRAEKIFVTNESFYFQRVFNNNSVVRSKFSIKKAEGYRKSLKAEYEILNKENKFEELKEQFCFYILRTSHAFIKRENCNPILVRHVQETLLEFKPFIDSVLKKDIFADKKDSSIISKDLKLFYKIIIKNNFDLFVLYWNRKNIKTDNKTINLKDTKKEEQINELKFQITIKEQAIKRIKNSLAYRIGCLFTYPLSFPLEFYRFIRDYNLIKKSGLFDSEYYLSQNEDVKTAKMDPIKHYLKFGWKEGRNPSAEFNGNDYLNKRPDVKVAGICPLVHYIKFGKDEM